MPRITRLDERLAYGGGIECLGRLSPAEQYRAQELLRQVPRTYAGPGFSGLGK